MSIDHGTTNIDSQVVNGADATTGPNTVNPGSYHVSETALTSYATTLECFNDIGGGATGVANDGIRNGTEPLVSSTGGDVSVTSGSDIVCTFTNTRDQGKIELRKHWSGTAGNTTVSITQGQTTIDSAVANGQDATTDENTVNTGSYHVSETALTSYATTLECFNDIGGGATGVANDGIRNGTEPLVSSTGGDVSVTTGDDIVCTFTNTRDQGKIELRKHWSGTAGNTTVSITQGQTTIDSAVANGQDATTDENTVNTGSYHVSETALTSYATTLECFNDIGGGATGVANDGIRNGTEPLVSSTGGDVSVTTGDDIVCTFTNTRDQGKIELRKHWSGTAGNTTVSITQGQTTIDSAVANGQDATTDENTVNTGSYHVSETALTSYATTLECFNDIGGGATGVANDGIRNGTEPLVSSTGGDVSVTTGDDIVCTFTNTRDQGKIELRKHWSGTAGNTTVSITQGQTTIDSAVANGQDATTDENTVNTGSYHVSETALTSYATTLECFNDIGGGATGVANDGIRNGTEPMVSSTSGDVSVTTGGDIVCTFTNTRNTGSLKVTKFHDLNGMEPGRPRLNRRSTHGCSGST